jgi:hypothetical protein
MLNKKKGENNIDWFKSEIKKNKKFYKKSHNKNLKSKERRLNLKPK